MFSDLTTNKDYPKTLEIRNTEGGMIWQIYHVNNKQEAMLLSQGAMNNAFMSRTLVDHKPDEKETFPHWRTQCHDKLKAVLT